MNCKYMVLVGSDLTPMPCARHCDETYCAEHLKTMGVVEALDRDLQQEIREKRQHPKRGTL